MYYRCQRKYGDEWVRRVLERAERGISLQYIDNVDLCNQMIAWSSVVVIPYAVVEPNYASDIILMIANGVLSSIPDAYITTSPSGEGVMEVS